MKIDRIIINRVENEILSFEIMYHEKPNYVVLAPWMVSILKESGDTLSIYTVRKLHDDIDRLCGLIVLESVKVLDLEEIEVY